MVIDLLFALSATLAIVAYARVVTAELTVQALSDLAVADG